MAEIDYSALTRSLSARWFLPQVFDTAAEAKAAALAIIGNQSVGIGGSVTVRDMQLAQALQTNGNEVYWHWLVAKEQKQAARDKALTADVYLSSTNALTTDGRLVNIDGTGNRAAGLIYGPHEVIVIAGKNKIVNTLDEAIDQMTVFSEVIKPDPEAVKAYEKKYRLYKKALESLDGLWDDMQALVENQ